MMQRFPDLKKAYSDTFLRKLTVSVAFAFLATNHAKAQSVATALQVTFCKIEIPLKQQGNADTVAFKFRVNLQGNATGITLVRRGLFVVDEQPFRDCISTWKLPVTDLQYLATFSAHDSGIWQEIDVDSKTFHRKLLPPPKN